jgi:hydroxysqualene synthase
MSAGSLSSGKGHRDENFPVASWILKAEHRAPIMAFYRFARAADDVADHPEASAAEKLEDLAEMRRGLAGKGEDSNALALGRVLAERRIDTQHAHDLLDAFVQDVTVRRYLDWDALMRYCRYSAMPVGRFVLDVHGESRALWPANDALCAALQVINHLQDCGRDYRALDRVYMPEDVLPDASVLAGERATPDLRAAIAGLAGRTRGLLAESAGFARAIRDRRLGAEVAVIQRLAEDLCDRLLRCDPLAERVHHRRGEAAWLAARAVVGYWARR